jgi:Uma2 family endonuclease
VTDRHDNWQKNFRCPDVVAFLKGNPAQNRDTHWLGGPDFAIEIVNPYDRAREARLLCQDRHARAADH